MATQLKSQMAAFGAAVSRRDRWSPIDDNGPHLPMLTGNDETNAYWEAHSPADDGMLCFGGNYAAIGEHLRSRPDIKSVTDIGCAWGVQQMYLEHVHYIGVDAQPATGFGKGTERWNTWREIPWFRQDHPGVEHHVATFPAGLTGPMIGDAFISNMAIGYGPSAPLDDVLAGFARFRHGYFRGKRDLREAISGRFLRSEIVRPSSMEIFDGLWFFSQD